MKNKNKHFMNNKNKIFRLKTFHSGFLSILFMSVFMLTLGLNAVFAGSGTVTVNLLSSTSSGLSGGKVYYYNGGWQLLGTTDGTGTVSGTVPKTTDIEIRYAGGTKKWANIDPATSPVLAITTVLVTVKLETCGGTPLVGVAKYSFGGEFVIGNTPATIELLPYSNLGPGQGNYDFKVTYDGRTSPWKTQDISVNPTVMFTTTKVNLSYTGNIYYYKGGWQLLTSPKEMMGGSSNKYTDISRADFKFGSMSAPTKTMEINGCDLSGNVNIFYTKKADGSALPNIRIQRNDYGNHYVTVGNTDANGYLFTLDQPNGTWKYKADKNYSAMYLTAGPSTFIFQTSKFIAHVLNHDGNDFAGIRTQYNDYGNHWIDLDPQYTDANGNASIELFPGTFDFKASKDYSSEINSLSIVSEGNTDVVTFQTALAIGIVKDCDNGNPVQGINVQYNDYGNHWINLSPSSTGVDGLASIELFPGTFNLKAKTIYTDQTLSIILTGPSTTVEFNPTRVCINNGVGIQYNDYGNHWINLPCNTYMFPGTYNFHFKTGTIWDAAVSLDIADCEMNYVYLRVRDENGNGVAGATAKPACGGSWKPVLTGSTNASGVLLAEIPSCFTKISMTANQTGKEQTLAQLAASYYIWKTEILRIKLNDHEGNAITDEAGFLKQGGGSWYNWGYFNASGYFDVQLFPGTVKFNVAYNYTSQDKSGIIVSSGAGIQEVNFQTGQVVSDCGHTLYSTGTWRAFTSGIELMPGTYTFKSPTTSGTITAGEITDLCDAGPAPFVGVREVGGNANELSVYPNPASNKVFIKFNTTNNGQSSLKIIDLVGKVVVDQLIDFVGGTNTANIDLSNLTNGTYLLVFNSGEMHEVRKITVLH